MKVTAKANHVVLETPTRSFYMSPESALDYANQIKRAVWRINQQKEKHGSKEESSSKEGT